MKKKLLLTVVCVLLIATLCALFAGCTQENYKQKAIATNFSDKVYSNGGLAVVYGEYLYFINGYPGYEVDNTFGKVVKGAIMRVALKDNKPSGEPVTIVPKNVYGTDAEYGGLYIVNDYIYYSTPNSERDSSGKQKTNQMKLMRTKVDGSVTEEILAFNDFSVVFAVEGDRLIYVRDNYLYTVDLTQKKFEAVKVEENTILTNYKMVPGYIIYCMYVDNNSEDYIMKSYKWSGGEPVVLMEASMLRKDKDATTTYTLSLINAESDQSTYTLYYTKTDNELNTPEVGICSYTFDKENPVFEKSKEVRYTNNTATTTNLNFSHFAKTGNYVLAHSDKTITIFNQDGTFFKTVKKDTDGELAPTLVTFSETIVVKKVVERDDGVYLWYTMSEVLYEIKLFSIENGAYVYDEFNAKKIFSGKFDTAWLSFEEINGVIYYFNTDISKNIYYYIIPDEVTSDTDTAAGKLLGVITEEDFIAAF
ncbi:MAG: hypothetical protein GX242_03935 [Clostridiales bacterium]|jgi:hypothetical protein|nr:hypothetical protein [Clostridiales bacterium]